MTRSLLDTALDLSVLGGYTSVGYRIRSRDWKALPRMQGKVVIVTGATSGLGLAAADGFARLGATVWLAVRNRERGEQARALILEHRGEADIRIDVCDVSRLESVRRFAERFTAEAPRLDVLVNNAGVLTQERELSADGIELTLATNVIGPFLLTQLLIPVLKRSAPSRIVNVSSGGMYTQKLRADDLQSEQGDFDGPTVYARTKRAEVVLTELWAQRLAGTGVTAHAMHPGWADTPGVQSSLPRFYRTTRPMLCTPDQGADTIVWLGAAAEPAASPGGVWHDRRRRPTHLFARNAGNRGGAAPSVGRVRGFEFDQFHLKEKAMARYQASIDTQWTPDEAFAYLSDFSTTAEWDPGVVEAERVGAGAIGEGTEFRLVAEFLGRKTPLTYRVVEYEAPRAVTFVGENATVISLDRITFEPMATGTRVTYDAELRLKGPLRLADPLLALAFNRVGNRALGGLREVLAGPAHGRVDAAA